MKWLQHYQKGWTFHFESDLLWVYQEIRTMAAKRYFVGELRPVAKTDFEGDTEPFIKAIKMKIKPSKQDMGE